jgi:osmotically-inducible protein OsmY
MKNALLVTLTVALPLALFSCKGKNTSTTTTDTTVTAPAAPVEPEVAPAPVVVSADDSLATKAKDAIKDYPGVNVTISNGVVTLTGEIKRDELPKVMQAVNAINPKKVNNELTIK